MILYYHRNIGKISAINTICEKDALRLNQIAFHFPFHQRLNYGFYG